MKITVYTDGGCSMKMKLASWAFVLKGDTEDQDIPQSGVFSDMTNNQAELFAVIAALDFIDQNYPAGTEIELWSDSQYVIRGGSEWLFGWKKNGWKTKAGKVKNQGYWETFDNYLANMNVTLMWTRGHIGNEYNEKCDVLCTEAIQAAARAQGKIVE